MTSEAYSIIVTTGSVAQQISIVEQQEILVAATGSIGPQGSTGAQGSQGPQGGTGAGGSLAYYGAFSSVNDQVAVSANTAYPMIFETTDENNGITMAVNGSGNKTRITFGYAGTYNLQWSGQFENSDAQEHDVNVWLRKNGVDVPGSTGVISVAARKGTADFTHNLPSWNFVFTVAANDYYEFVWSTTDVAVSIQAYAAGTSPTRPSTASLVLTVQQIMYTILGPQGAQGSQGPQGATGPQGFQGAQGSQGATGSQGPTGAQGSTGATGAQGSQGAQGFQGSQGATGSQGPQGYQGDTGPQGFQGTTGAQGATGSQGPQGFQGDVGAQGATGPQGPQGPQGSTGSQGFQGPQGATGQSNSFYNYKALTTATTGNPGAGFLLWSSATQISSTRINTSHLDSFSNDIDVFLASLAIGDKIFIQSASSSNDYQHWEITGTPTLFPNSYLEFPVTHLDSAGVGATNFANNADVLFIFSRVGPQGPQGAQGATGSQGAQGATGSTGPQGSQGPQGVQGADGAQGSQGPQGFQGPQGSQGPQGAAGTQGIDGPQGAQGATGPQGAEGPQGSTGATGAQGPQGSQGPQGATGVAIYESDQSILSIQVFS